MTLTKWDEDFDVVVVGSGLAGLSAAIEARKLGASVVVLEKMNVSGGNSRISDGGLAAAGSFLQKEKGVRDSPELLYQDILKAGLFLNHQHLAKILADQSAEIIEWTRTELGVKYQERLDRAGGHSVARILTTRSHSGVEIIKPLVKNLRELGGELRKSCILKDLVAEREGSVLGVKINSGYQFPDDHSGEKKYIRANRAVVLATGGFSNDIPFRSLQNPLLDETVASTNHRGATAEGLRAAIKINCAQVHLSWIQTGPWACADEAGYGKGGRFASYAVYPQGIVIDPATGCRIVNEWGDRRERSDAIIKCGHPCIGIVDANGAEADSESLAHGLKSGKVREFTQLLELAKSYEIPAEQLQKTIVQYNEMIESRKTDSFGKALQENAQPLKNPPFYSIRLWPKVHYTPGGLAIDHLTRVLDFQRRPIARLFAAGEICGGIHGASRLGSCALPECLIFGRIAGQQAAISPVQ